MSVQLHTPVRNIIATRDRFGVKVFSRELDAHLVFEAFRRTAHSRDQTTIKFKCAVFDAPSLTDAKYIPMAATPAREGSGRSCNAEATSLAELIAILDWAHTPSELALLRMLLSSRVLTCCGEPIGDAVFQQLSEADAAELSARRAAHAQETLRKSADDLVAQARTRADAYVARAMEAIRFGVIVPMPADLAELAA